MEKWCFSFAAASEYLEKPMNQKIKEFELWFAYYDSLFMCSHPKLSLAFYEEHFVPESFWNDDCCEILAKTYEYFENFIKNPSNWTNSQCKLEELESIQAEINNLLIFLTMEKSYAYLFWKTDRRRVEASLAHLYTFLQMLIQAVIPYPTMNIFECKTANKLCIDISKLEKLINVVLKCVNPMAKYLSGPKFQEEASIIRNFFENMLAFMKKLPHIKRNKLAHIHNLTKFIVLSNPIEICTGSKNTHEGIRKKSNTVGAELKHRSYPDSSANYESDKIYELSEIKRSYSCVEFEKHQRKTNWGNVLYSEKLFKFPERIVKYAMEEEVRKKAVSLESLTTLKNKKSFLEKNKTEMTNETRTQIREVSEEKITHSRKREKARSYIHTRNHSRSIANRPTNNTVQGSQSSIKKLRFYDKESERDEEQMSVRSEKESTIRKRELSIHTQSNIQKGSCEINENNEFFYQSKVNFSIVNGSVAKSKWDIVRAYVRERVKMRKLQKVLEQEE